MTARPSKRTNTAARKAEAKRHAEANREIADEAITPAVMRHDVTDASGQVIRAARVKRDGITFVRSSPIDYFVARGRAALERGETPLIGLQHKLAADRLSVLWSLVGDGVGVGASDWGKVGHTSGSSGAPAGHSALLDQVARRAEIEAAAAFLGALWPIVRAVALEGMGLPAWAEQAQMDVKAAAGFLRAALDRLVEFYGRDTRPQRAAKIRTMAPGRGEYSTAPDTMTP